MYNLCKTRSVSVLGLLPQYVPVLLALPAAVGLLGLGVGVLLRGDVLEDPLSHVLAHARPEV